jgi:hypothetical protein
MKPNTRGCTGCLALKDNKCEFGYKRDKWFNRSMGLCPKPISLKQYECVKIKEKELLKNYWLVPMIG